MENRIEQEFSLRINELNDRVTRMEQRVTKQESELAMNSQLL